jgi:hypothetical protein
MKPVNVNILGSLTQVDSTVAPILAEVFAYTCKRRVREGQDSHTLVQAKSFCGGDVDAAMFPTGLVPTAKRRLEAEGFTVEIIDHRRDRQPLVPDQQVCDQLEPDEKELIQAIQKNRLGQIHVRSEQDVYRLTAVVCRVFPTSNVLVLVSSHKQVAAVFDGFAWLLAHRIGRIKGGRSDLESCQRQIASVASCALRETKGWDIVLMPDGRQAIRDKFWREIIEANPNRLFGFFVPNGKQLSPRQHLMLEGVLGSVVHQSPGLDGTAARVQAAVLPPQAQANASRQGILAVNSAAALALATCDGNTPLLNQYGMPASFLQFAGRADCRTVLIVDSVEEARQMLPLLPGWCVKQHLPQLEDSPLPRPLTRVVLTRQRAELIPNFDVDVVVLVLAAAGSWCPTGFPPRRSGEAAEVWLVDVADGSNQRALAAAGRRQLEYHARGWHVHALNPEGHT